MKLEWTAEMCLIFSIYGCFCVSFLFLPYSTVAASSNREFEVGNGVGWRQPPPDDSDFYYRWASYRKFQLGDSLRFRYENDTVFIVDKWGYYHCDANESYAWFSDGDDTVVRLDRAGPLYIISGDPEHCRNGQRIQLVVIGSRSFSPVDPPSAEPPIPPSPFSGAPNPEGSGRSRSRAGSSAVPGAVPGAAPALLSSTMSVIGAAALFSLAVALL